MLPNKRRGKRLMVREKVRRVRGVREGQGKGQEGQGGSGKRSGGSGKGQEGSGGQVAIVCCPESGV